MMVNKTPTVEETIRRLIIRINKNDNIIITPNSTFRELGVDSLDVVQIMVSLEDIYGIDLVDDEMKSIKNMKDFIKYIQNKIGEKKSQKTR